MFFFLIPIVKFHFRPSDRIWKFELGDGRRASAEDRRERATPRQAGRHRQTSRRKVRRPSIEVRLAFRIIFAPSVILLIESKIDLQFVTLFEDVQWKFDFQNSWTRISFGKTESSWASGGRETERVDPRPQGWQRWPKLESLGARKRIGIIALLVFRHLSSIIILLFILNKKIAKQYSKPWLPCY